MKALLHYILVVVVAAAVGQASAFKWRTKNTLDCARHNWYAIKARSDAYIPMAKFFLVGERVALLNKLLDGKKELPSTPTDAFIKALPDAIPETFLDMIAGDVIGACLSGEMREWKR